jgi:hypothetical protein
MLVISMFGTVSRSPELKNYLMALRLSCSNNVGEIPKLPLLSPTSCDGRDTERAESDS